MVPNAAVVPEVLDDPRVQPNPTATVNATRWRAAAPVLAVVVIAALLRPVSILIFQHILGVASCGLIAYVAARLTRSVVGGIAGLLLALDPWLFALESYALSETLTVALLAFVIAVTVGPARPRAYHALLIGMALGAACLTRPACQVLVPFVGLAWLVRAGAGRNWRGLLIGATAGIIGLGGVLGPWVLFNKRRRWSGLGLQRDAVQGAAAVRPA
jgi:4-amino-4-deoxy-L-arabinose transferase-like glycosyltransferase